MEHRTLLRLRGFVLTAILLVTVFVIKYLDVWNKSFDQESGAYISYNVSRFVFLCIFVWIVFAAGRIFLKPLSEYVRMDEFDEADYFILCSFVGAGAINILVFVLGIFSLIRIEVTLSIAIVLIYISSFYFGELEIVKKKYLTDFRGIFSGEGKASAGKHFDVLSRIINIILVLLIVAALWEVFIKRGMVPHLPGNDLPGTYFPSYDDIVNDEHGFWPTIWFIHYYTAKGIGLQFFGMSLTDIFTSQLVNFYLFFLSALILVQILRKISPNKTWVLIALLLFLRSPMAAAPFGKNHVALSAYIIFICYLCIGVLASPKDILPDLRKALLISVVSCVLLLPVSSCFCFALIGSAFIYAAVVKAWDKARLFLYSGIATLLTLFGIYAFNYFQSGLVDMTVSVFDRYLNREIYAKWNHELVLLMQRFFNQGEGYASLMNLVDPEKLRRSMRHATGAVVNIRRINEIWIVVGMVGLAIVLGVMRIKRFARASGDGVIGRIRESTTARIIFMCGSGWGTSVLVLGVFVHAAMGRATVFRGAFFIVILCGILILLTRYALSVRWRKPVNVMLPVVVVIIGTWLSPTFLRSTAGPKYYQFLYGKKTFFDVVCATWPMHLEWYVHKNIVSEKRVVHLNFVPGAYMLPGANFQRPLKNVYKADFPKVLYGSPEEALAALKANGVEYVMVDLHRRLGVTSLAPVFAPESLIQNFRMVAGGRMTYLLTLGGSEGERVRQDSYFIRNYSIIRNHPNGFVRGHKKLYEFGKKTLNRMKSTKDA